MNIPGGNLFNMAAKLIATQTIQYYKFKARTPNSIGLDVTTYFSPQPIKSSVQPVPREIFEQLGLDMQRTYYNFYVPHIIIDIERDVSGDEIFFNGQTFSCLSVTPWVGLDGWNAVLAVRVPKSAGAC